MKYTHTAAPAATCSRHPTAECLSAYIDVELGPAPRAALERHLRTCGRCAGMVLGYRAVGGVLRRVPPRPLPPAREGALPWERLVPAGARRPAAAQPA